MLMSERELTTYEKARGFALGALFVCLWGFAGIIIPGELNPEFALHVMFLGGAVSAWIWHK